MNRSSSMQDALRGKRASWFRAPGRVNLMGDHTDYNEGFVLPMAIQLDCMIASVRKPNGPVTVRSLNVDETVTVAADGSDDPSTVDPGWGRYVGGVVIALAERGRASIGMDAVVSSTVPLGSGLSSSAALEVAIAIALLDAGGLELPKVDIAVACRHAEQIATGVPCGIMDQMISLLGRRGRAMLIDCRTLETRAIRIPKEVAVVAVHSGISRRLNESAYAERRNSCIAAAAAMGLSSLRDADLDQADSNPRARHVVTENARVLSTVDALEAGDIDEAGKLFLESHQSLRDDYQVSTPELDTLVEALVNAGAAGARLTGAGFGGCVVALADGRRAESIAEEAAAAYARQTGLQPTVFICNPVAGSGKVNAENG